MQNTLNQLKDSLWSRLNPFFVKHAQGSVEIQNSQIQPLIRDIFSDASNQDIDYVIKNMHRLDVDDSGQVSFPQFANFLFKKHCGQMSLQKRHLKGSMIKGSQRKMNKEEFKILINEAIKFLKTTIADELCQQIFISTDKDKDGYITYVEYFQAIDAFICKSKSEIANRPREVVVEPKPLPKSNPRGSRIRIYIWTQLRKLYEGFIVGRRLPFSQLRSLIIHIIGELTELQVTFILSGLYQMSGDYITFIEFAVRFIYLIAEVGLSRFSQNHPQSQRRLDCGQFLILFRNTFKFLNISGINPQFIKLIYLIIKGNRQYVTYDDFLSWVRVFLACQHWYGQPYYFIEDDPDKRNGQGVFLTPKPIPTSKPLNTTNFTLKFSNHDLAYAVRTRVFNLLARYDFNQDQLFSKNQIEAALTDLLKEDKHELQYVTRNVFRYDRDGDQSVTYDQLTNFCVQQHFGEMAIQRLHRKKFYCKGNQRIMNKEQFTKTLNYALSFIQMQATTEQVNLLFSEIDLDQDGWISYELYFVFLRYYFGSLSTAYLKPNIQQKKPASFKTILLNSLNGLSHFDRLIRLLMEQLRYIFLQYDENKNLSFEPNQIEQILINVFGFQVHEIKLIMFEIFRVNASYAQTVQFQELASIILSIFFVHIWLQRRFDNVGKRNWKQRKINLGEFKRLMIQGCYFITIKPFDQDLEGIFFELDTNKDGYITLEEYIVFIRRYIGRNMTINDEPPTIQSPRKKTNKLPPGVDEDQYLFVEAIWGQLRVLFAKYDKGSKGYMTQEQFKVFAIQVLNEKSDNQLKYIFWNLFRLDSDFDKKIQFLEFAPYVLKHAGQISLQKFHAQQVNGKNTLSEEQLFIVISNAYSFLTTMPKSRSVVSKIFKRLSKNAGVSYGSYLGWVTSAISKQFR